jgi:hypothetical protein
MVRDEPRSAGTDQATASEVGGENASQARTSRYEWALPKIRRVPPVWACRLTGASASSSLGKWAQPQLDVSSHRHCQAVRATPGTRFVHSANSGHRARPLASRPPAPSPRRYSRAARKPRAGRVLRTFRRVDRHPVPRLIVAGGLGAPRSSTLDGWPDGYEARHHYGCKLTHVGQDAGRRHDTGLDESE